MQTKMESNQSRYQTVHRQIFVELIWYILLANLSFERLKHQKAKNWVTEAWTKMLSALQRSLAHVITTGHFFTIKTEKRLRISPKCYFLFHSANLKLIVFQNWQIEKWESANVNKHKNPISSLISTPTEVRCQAIIKVLLRTHSRPHPDSLDFNILVCLLLFFVIRGRHAGSFQVQCNFR